VSTPEAVAALERFGEFLADHEPHRWEKVGPCVWCADCNLRLYQGELPDHKDPGRAERQANCDHDWDPEMGQGFYIVCRTCGYQEWCE
jgi:hypothetical protein